MLVRLGLVVSVLLALVPGSAAAQPGANANLPSLTGDPLDTGALNSGFNMLATTLQAQAFLFSNPAIVATLVEREREYRQRLAEMQAQLKAHGEDVIANGTPSTSYAQSDDKALEPAIRNVFGYRGQSTPLVPVGLPLFRNFMAQQGLAQDDVGDAAAMLIATCYQIVSNQLDVSPAAMADLRDRARRDLLADPLFQGMGDQDRQFMYDVIGVWAVQSAADYHEFTARLAQGNFPSTVQALAQLRTTCGTMLQQTLGTPPEKVHFTTDGVVLD